jgi:hypothetical protein
MEYRATYYHKRAEQVFNLIMLSDIDEGCYFTAPYSDITLELVEDQDGNDITSSIKGRAIESDIIDNHEPI